MQEEFNSNPVLVAQFKQSLSAPRFSRYLREAKGDEIRAVALYQWNSKISQSLYIYLQTWEICLRNRVNDFLIWKYGVDWPLDSQRFIRQLKKNDKARVLEAVERQRRERRIQAPSNSMVVADISAGFWVSQLSSAYDVPYSWRYNLAKIFPNDPTLTASHAWQVCDRLLSLRNRVAHHEPIFTLPLDTHHSEMVSLVEAMCQASSKFAHATCNFKNVWPTRP